MRQLVGVLFGILLMASLAVTEEPSPRLRALARVDALIEKGELDEADRLLHHLTEHNPGDPDLARLREKLRIRQGKLGSLLDGGDALGRPERRADLRAACWRIVAATASGNPEEVRGLVDAGDEPKLREVLAVLDRVESGASREVATEIRAWCGDGEARAALVDRVERGDLSALVHLPEDLVRAHQEKILADLRSAVPTATACGLAGRLRLAPAKPRLAAIVRKGDPANRVAAAGALLAMGDAKARRVLEALLVKGRPSEIVAAVAALAAHPGSGKTPHLDLLRRLETKPPVPRLRSTLVEAVLDALGRSDEPGARENLVKRLDGPEFAMAAARALGELGDAAAVPAVLDYLRSPPRPAAGEGEATAGGLGYLGGRMGGEGVARAFDLQSRLVAAVALLRMTGRR